MEIESIIWGSWQLVNRVPDYGIQCRIATQINGCFQGNICPYKKTDQQV